jgi:catechol 2,3-dioxygenase-like lactoylglutathione lyase family enzyme
MTSTTRVHFEHSTPILRVESMEAALAFYVGKLGFENAEWGGDDFTHLSRDGAGIYLSLGDQGLGKAWIWIGVEDVRRLAEELQTAGIPLRMGPQNFPWALEIQVEDPDGNVIRFGSEPEPEQ